VRAVGGGFFDDRNPTIIPVDNPGAPVPIDRGNRTGSGVVVPSPTTNRLTVIPDLAVATPVPFSLPSGGLRPVAVLADDFNFDGFFDAVVANNGDGRLALFLGGNQGLSLSQVLIPTQTGLPHPTALALDSFGDGLLSFYASTEGLEAATLLAFNLRGGDGSDPPPGIIIPGPGAGSPVPPTPSQTEEVVQLGRLSETALDLVATLSTVALVMDGLTTQAGATAAPNAAEALATFSNGTTVAPAQGASSSEGQDDAAATTDDTEEPSDDPQEDAAEEEAAEEEVPAWIRFFAGLDEGFEWHRRAALDEQPTSAGSPSGTAEWLSALDAVLDGWSLAARVANWGQPSPAEWLRQAAGATTRVLDAALQRLGSEERARVPPPSAPIPEPARSTPPPPDEPGAPSPTDVAVEVTSAASVPLVLSALLLARRAWPQLCRRRRRSRPGALSRDKAMLPKSKEL
jgi:hypothetical protein